ncbi:MAG: CDP-glycerol glycerophosphotransferase family protein [Stackebrandtia sp.]
MPTNLFRFVLRKLLPAAFPAAAVVVFALTDLPWLGYGLCLATLLYLTGWFTRVSVAAARTGRGIIIAAALLGTEAFRNGDLDASLAVAAGLLLALIGVESLVYKSLRTGRVPTENVTLPRTTLARLSRPRTVACANYTTTAVFILCAALKQLPSMLIVALFCLLAVAQAVIVALGWLRRRDVAYQTDGEVLAAVEAHAPKFAVYFSGPSSSAYQLLMWLPYFDQLGDPYVIILREGRAAKTFAAATETPIVVAPSIAAMESMLVPTIRAVFYVNNGMKNTHCVRFGELTHIQMMHGDSEKPASRNPVSAMYDRVFVAGQAGVERYRRYGVKISDEQFRIVGRPQVASVRVDREPIAGKKNPTVLYAPTWTGDSADVNFSSLPLGEKLITELLDRGATVLMREHPFTRRNAAAARQLDRVEELLAADRTRTGRAHRFGAETAGEVTLADCFNDADALISDVSGVVSDWLYSEKPFAVADMLAEDEEFAESFPLSRASYVIRHDGDNIPQTLDLLLESDPSAGDRRAMKSHYLGDFPAETYEEAFLSAARECYEQPAMSEVVKPREEPMTGSRSAG